MGYLCFTNMVFISGGHGGFLNETDGIKKGVLYGQVSCYSEKNLLEYDCYNEMCGKFSLEAKQNCNKPFLYPITYIPRIGPKILKLYGDEGSNINVEKIDKEGPRMTNMKNKHQSLWSKINQILYGESGGVIKSLNEINVAVLNIANYHKTTNKDGKGGMHLLIDHLNKLNPNHLMIDWCYASNGDLAMDLRATGLYSDMILNHDIRWITNNDEAEISEEQKAFLKEAIKDENKLILVPGRKGSGKTIMAAEIAKTKIAKAIASGQTKIKLIVRLHPNTTWDGTSASLLAMDFQTRYLKGFHADIANVFIEKNYSFEKSWKIEEFQEWCIEQFDTPNGETVVMIHDDMLLMDLPDYTKLDKLNGAVICCTSTVEWDEHEDNPCDELEEKGWCIPKGGKLSKSFRYTPKIAEFLHHHGDTRDGGAQGVSLPDDKGFYPEELSKDAETEWPVIWLEVSDQYDESKSKESLKKMSKLISDKLPDKRKGDDRKVLCIRGVEYLDDTEFIWGYGPVEGVEADVGIVDMGYFMWEQYSRARKQLFIVTSENDPRNLNWSNPEGLTEEELIEKMRDRDILRRLKDALNPKRLNPSDNSPPRLVKKEVTYAELQDGTWWNKVKKDKTDDEGEQNQEPEDPTHN